MKKWRSRGTNPLDYDTKATFLPSSVIKLGDSLLKMYQKTQK